MMNTLRKWMPIGLCCLPGVVVGMIVIVGSTLGIGVLNGPLGSGLLTLAALACPISMGLRMRQMDHRPAPNPPSQLVNCCPPNEMDDPLNALRAKRESLEREIAELKSASNN